MTSFHPAELEEWDYPFFKILSRNDSGEARSHQGGVNITREIRGYFPALETVTDAPTAQILIKVELWDGDSQVGDVTEARFQHQTWSGTRSPECRITRITSLLRHSRENDILLFQANYSDELLYRLELIRQEARKFTPLMNSIGDRRAGSLNLEEEPFNNQRIFNTEAERLNERLQNDFTLFESEENRRVQQSVSYARDRSFKRVVLRNYEKKCGICGSSLQTGTGQFELEAGHIVPRNKNGSEDARNGILFCRKHHWAFDRGLFSIGDDRKIIVSESCKGLAGNEELIRLEGRCLARTIDENANADTEALGWHRDNILR